MFSNLRRKRKLVITSKDCSTNQGWNCRVLLTDRLRSKSKENDIFWFDRPKEVRKIGNPLPTFHVILQLKTNQSLNPLCFTCILTPRARRSDSSSKKYLLAPLKIGLKFLGHISPVVSAPEDSSIILLISRHN